MTKASTSPVKRIVSDSDGNPMIAEIEDRIVTLRPFRTRKGGPAEISVTWGAIYFRAMVNRAELSRKRKVR